MSDTTLQVKLNCISKKFIIKSTTNILFAGKTKCWREITIIKGVSVGDDIDHWQEIYWHRLLTLYWHVIMEKSLY